MQSDFASTLAVLGPNAQYTVETIKNVTGGTVDIRFFEPGTLVPASQTFDAVASGALDSAWIKAKWDTLSATQKAQVTAACDSATLRGFASSEYLQVGALQELKAKGVNFMTWDKTFLEAYRKAREEVAVEQSAKSPEFKKARDSLSKFRGRAPTKRDSAGPHAPGAGCPRPACRACCA
ncbi:MAG: hypothetical protein FJX35_20895 [Alphaproteobacteria bacterium]|nr:hypothetical protein [Alphaproteobacteria bacterium]